MATRRKGNVAEAVRPEEQEDQSTRAQESAESGNGAAPMSSAPRPNGPVPAEPMSQNRNAAELEDRVRRRAYEIYEARGRQDGRADEDWLLAEEEITGITGGG